MSDHPLRSTDTGRRNIGRITSSRSLIAPMLLDLKQRTQARVGLVEDPPRPPHPRRTRSRCLPKEHRFARQRKGDHEGCTGLGGEWMAMYGSRLTRLLSFDDDLRYLLLWNALFCSCRCDTGRKEGLQYFPVHPTQHRGPVKHTNNIYSIARSSFSQSRAFTNLECRSQTRRAIESMKTGRNARIDTGRCQRLLQYMFVSEGQLSGKNQSAHSAVPL